MVTSSKLLAPASSTSHLRAFNARTDMGAVADLVELCFADTLDEGGRSYLRHMRSAARTPGALSWITSAFEWDYMPMTGYVWLQDGRLVGNATLIPFFLTGRRCYLIANVAVHPDYRRRGIGRSLTNRAIEHARRRRSPSVWLHVRQENEAAVTLYRSLGFDERMRRTTWFGLQDYTPAVQPPGVTFTSPLPRDWEIQRTWLHEAYPPEVSWHMPYQTNALHPGLLGSFFRFFFSFYITQWAALRESSLLGAAAWQAMGGPANYLWLAAPPDVDENVVHALLVHARRHIPSQRPLTLDYPAGQFSSAIQKAGFEAQQTLIWMVLALKE